MKKHNKDNDNKNTIKHRLQETIQKIKIANTESKLKTQLIESWGRIMKYTNTYNSMGCTFEITEEKITDYGWTFKILNSYGLTFDKLETITPQIRDGLMCAYFIYTVHESNSFAICKVIYSQKLKINKIPFKPVKVKPWELYIGNDVSGEPIIIDTVIAPQMFIAGQTRRGKNGSLNHILISLINSCSTDEVMIYYYQGAKGDGGFYKTCKHVYAYAQYEIEKLLTMLKHIEKEMANRTNLFQNMIDTFKGDNLYQYNKLNPNKKLPFIYIVIDEFLECVVKSSDKGEVKSIKLEIESLLTKVAQFGGSLGVSYIISHQKPEKALCPSFLKNMSNVRLCFGYDDSICSEIVLGTGDTSAVGLPPRRAVYKTHGTKSLIFTTNLEGKIEEYLRPFQMFNKRDLFKDLEKINKSPQQIEKVLEKINTITKETVIKNTKKSKKESSKPKTQEDKLIDFIVKHKDTYVPYNQSEQKILDMIRLKGDE